jgi:NTP pyrophosphatase (non-canonical NTP hydrolase)
MDFTEYQELASKTAIFPIEKGLEYCTLGLASEAGEVAGKVKKIIRDKSGVMSTEDGDAIAAEIGDCLWYLANLCDVLMIPMDQVAKYNLWKLEDRMKRNAIKGSGDNR